MSAGRRFGPRVDEGGAEFRLYAPDVSEIQLLIEGRTPRAMERGEDGFFRVHVPDATAGTLYRFRVAGHDVPDPASRMQAEDTDGWSVLVADQSATQAPDAPVRPWHEAVIAEVHVGTATPEGTFCALIERLDHYRDAGFTVIELMPVADFPGKRNWGYDGVLLYAPDRAYGTPDDLRTLVEAAHARGLGVLLDVVYNHFGPSGNYLPLYARSFFRQDIATPWGPAIDLDNEMIRAFFTENAAYWLAEFGFDGLRFDAVHALATESAETFLREIAAACRAVRPEAFLVLENHDNISGWMTKGEQLFTAQWDDDWHHVFHVLGTGERTGYYVPYATDTIADAARALTEGFVFQGQPYPDADGEPRGTPSLELPPDAFVNFIQNHDHIGNRPLGDRLAATLSPQRLAFLRFVLMLSPQVPLLFMGEEALLPTPFPFFCDFEGNLGDAVRKGRRAEFGAFFDAHGDVAFPDPLDEATFFSAKLTPEDFRTPQAQSDIAIFRRLAEQRSKLVWPLTASRFIGAAALRSGNALSVTWRFEAGRLVMALNPGDEPVIIDTPADIPGTPAGASVGAVTHEPEARFALGRFAAAVWSLEPS